jgi:alpha-L-fucosidase
VSLAAFAILWVALSGPGRTGGQTTFQIDADDTPEEVAGKAAFVTPSPRQIAWQELEFAAFVHFGMNTFTDREWGDGKESPSLFNPTDLDARQWAEAVKAAGARMLILTAKHHDGFCLWPSRHTEHSVRNSPWRGGKGDVVREVSRACRAAGLKFGLYLSPWDRHEPKYGDSPAYNEHFRNQLRELLNVPPDKRGRIHENDVLRLRELGEALKATFAENLARGARATATHVRDRQFTAANTVDNDRSTYWCPEDGITAAGLEYELRAPAGFNVALIQERIQVGQRIEEVALDAWDGSGWQEISRAATVGYKRLLRFPEVRAAKVRLRILRSRVCPTIANFGLFRATAR